MPLSYKKASRLVRKLVVHKRFRSIVSSLFVAIFLVVANPPQAIGYVFGQTEINVTHQAVSQIIPSEEAILTTKKTSRLPVAGRLSQGFNFYHPGIDLEYGFNEPIYPFLAGVVYETGFQGGGYGNYVLINHTNGYFSLYAHLNTLVVKKDDEVTQESILGAVGITGYSTGSHLHLEIYENGIAVNPLTILPEVSVSGFLGSAKAIVGGPQSLPSRTLVLPISAQTPLVTPSQTAVPTYEQGEENKKEQRPSLGIWLPDELTTLNPAKAEDPADSKGNPQLPKLVQF